MFGVVLRSRSGSLRFPDVIQVSSRFSQVLGVSVCGSKCHKRVSKALERSRRFSRFSKVRKDSLKVLKGYLAFSKLKRHLHIRLRFSKVLQGSPGILRFAEFRFGSLRSARGL